MNSGVKLGVGITGGYLLGRTKKLKLAIGLGTWLMGRRLQMSPAQLALQGLTQLRETPEFAELSDRLRDEIGGAGKRALAAAATSRMESLTDKLHDRNSGLINGEPDDLYDDDRDEDDDYDEDDEPRAQADEDDYDDEDDDYDGESDEYDE